MIRTCGFHIFDLEKVHEYIFYFIFFPGMGRYKCVFSSEQEKELTDYVQDMESRLFGLTTTELRRLAYQLAQRNGLQHNFNNNDQIAGLDWLKGFLRRHQNLSLRTPEATSAARAMGFNEVSVGKFFDLLTKVMEEFNFRPTRIYNVDETGLTTVPKSQSKIIAMKRRRQVGTLTSGERGQLITAVLCMSAAGHYVPPFLIFPRVRMKDELLDGTPAETAYSCHISGWMQTHIFIEWMHHFIKHVKPSKDDPILLLLDGHVTHTKNLDLIDLAREHGVILLCFPPHCTHRLQPLDVSFMAPLSTFYSQEVKAWLRANPGRIVTQYQVGRLFGQAYARAATIQTAVSGFSKTGIYPNNRHVFGDADFAAAQTTERTPTDLAETNAVETEREKSPVASPSHRMSRETTPDPNFSTLLSSETILKRTSREATPEKHSIALNQPEAPVKSSVNSVNFAVSPKDIMPAPHSNRKHRNMQKHRGKTAILTESPYKKELEAIMLQKVKSAKAKAVKRKIVSKGKGKAKQKRKITKKQIDGTSSEEEHRNTETEEDDTLCVYCEENYSMSARSDGWVKCISCHNWAHEGCTGWLDEDLNEFQCDSCIKTL